MNASSPLSVSGWLAMFKNRLKFSRIIGREEDVVVGQFGKLLVDAKEEDEAGARRVEL